MAPGGWRLHFKGGWSGASWRVNQVMLLRDPPRRFWVAILTREQPWKRYGRIRSRVSLAGSCAATTGHAAEAARRDARRRAPDQVVVDDVSRSADRQPAAHQPPHRECVPTSTTVASSIKGRSGRCRTRRPYRRRIGTSPHPGRFEVELERVPLVRLEVVDAGRDPRGGSRGSHHAELEPIVPSSPSRCSKTSRRSPWGCRSPRQGR